MDNKKTCSLCFWWICGVLILDSTSNFFIQVLRWTIIALVLLGFLVYLFGFAFGFLNIFAFYSLGYWYELNWLPFYSLTIYPKSLTMFYMSPWPLTPWFLSPLSVAFILLAFSTIFLAILSKFEWFYLTMITALSVCFIQLSLIWEFVSNGDFTLTGFHYTTMWGLLGTPVLYLNLISFSNLLPIIIPMILFATSSVVFPFLYYFDAKKLFPDLKLPGVNKIVIMRGRVFRYLNVAEYTLLILLPLFLLWAFTKNIFGIEFPAYVLISRPFVFDIIILTFVYSIGLYFISIYLENRFWNDFAREFIPILADKLRTLKKPVISVDELKKDLGLSKVRRLTFKGILRRIMKPAKTEGLLYFGEHSNIVFLEEPLVKLLREDLDVNGFIDISSRALGLGVKPHVLKGICKILIREGFLGDAKISKLTVHKKV